MMKLVNLIILLLFLVSSAVALEEFVMPFDQFESALRNTTTAPNYVVVAVEFGNDKKQTICVETPFLLGAIHHEYELPYDDSGIEKVIKIALSKSQDTFRFSNEKAIENIRIKYTAELLTEIRSFFSTISKEDILTNHIFPSDSSKFNDLYIDKSGNNRHIPNEAIAHVIIEKGLMAGRGCIAPYIYVREFKHNPSLKGDKAKRRHAP